MIGFLFLLLVLGIFVYCVSLLLPLFQLPGNINHVILILVGLLCLLIAFSNFPGSFGTAGGFGNTFRFCR